MNALVGRVIQYDAVHYAEATVERAATALAVSRWTLSREFRDGTGMTPRDYFTRVRVEAAICMLRETELKLSAIAERVGVCDASHLSRLFLKYVGAMPGASRAAQ